MPCTVCEPFRYAYYIFCAHLDDQQSQTPSKVSLQSIEFPAELNQTHFAAHLMLPPELLTQVFLHVRPYHWTKEQLRLFVSMSEVHSSWHVACEDPNLWNIVPCPTSSQTRKMLSKSADAPLFARMLQEEEKSTETSEELADQLENVKLLFREFHRIDSLDLFGALPGQLPYLYYLLSVCGQQPAPLLRQLVVAWHSGDDTRKDWDAYSSQNVDLHGAESALTFVRLWSAPFPMLTASFPYLTDLEIKDLPWTSRIHVIDMLRALSRMPALTSLALTEALTISNVLACALDPPDIGQARVTMPCLQYAYIDEDYEIAAHMYMSLSSPEIMSLEVPWTDDSDEVPRYDDMFRWQLVSDFFRIQCKKSSRPFPICHIERLGPENILIRLYNPHNLQAPQFVAYLTGGRFEGQYQRMMAVGLKAAAMYRAPCLELRHLEGFENGFKLSWQFWYQGLSMANATLQQLHISSWKDAALGLLHSLSGPTHQLPGDQSSHLQSPLVLPNLRLLVINEPHHDWLAEQQSPVYMRTLNAFVATLRQRKALEAVSITIRFVNRNPRRVPSDYWSQLEQKFEGLATVEVCVTA